MNYNKNYEQLKNEFKAEIKANQKIQNKLLKSIETEIKKTKNFQYCRTGNESYLNDTIRIILSSKITYLNALKNEILGI